ncbi:MAG TPA: hypothetical protein VKV27_07400 [Solirubrobacteraceae bacterium]|nr:hypothetical protein [Solirubrobacteraceae bacterium]
MIVQAYGAAILMVACAVVVGHALCLALAGRRSRAAAPAIGLAALIVVSEAAIELPGGPVAAVTAAALAVALSTGFLLWRRSAPIGAGQLIAAALALCASAIPFVANGRVGLPGVSLDDDTATFLLYTEGLRSPAMHRLWGPANGYPLGPQSLAATVSSATGMGLDMAFVGLMIAIVVITAITAASIPGRGRRWAAAPVGLLCALPYLAAAYYGEGSFKEPLMALFLLAFVLALEQALEQRTLESVDRTCRSLAPLPVLLAGAVYTYSYTAVAWFGGTVAIWAIAFILRHPRRARALLDRRVAIQLLPWASGGLLAIALLLAPVVGQLTQFYSQVGVSPSTGAIPRAALGNLVHPLSAYEALGIWPSPDFRLAPANAFHAGELGAFALALLIFALLRSVRGDRLLMPAAVVASLLIWWRANGTQSPYLAAKALVIAAPVVMAIDLRELLLTDVHDRATGAVLAALGLAFCAFSAYSSSLALRNEPVGAPEAGGGLSALRRLVGSAPVLYLGDDQYAAWELRPAAVSVLDPSILSLGRALARPGAGPSAGQPGFSSVVPASLDRFRFVITSNSPYASPAPPNFHVLARTRMYVLWQRSGPTPELQTIAAPGAPGALADCESAGERALSRRAGVALVSATPVTAPGPGLLPGDSQTVSLPLPTGRWELSLQYVSDFALTVSAPGLRATMPPLLGTPGPYFAAGEVTGRGARSPLPVTLHLARPSTLTGSSGLQYADVAQIAATRVPDPTRLVPLRDICGRYVAWYRLSGGGR